MLFNDVMKSRVFHTLRSRAWQPPKAGAADLAGSQGIASDLGEMRVFSTCQVDPADLIICGTPVALTMATP